VPARPTLARRLHSCQPALPAQFYRRINRGNIAPKKYDKLVVDAQSLEELEPFTVALVLEELGIRPPTIKFRQ
jgi:hypothetical protein